MSALLSLARAARLVGVPRGALQRKIANGELASFDGLVSLEELRRNFPNAELVDSGALEKTERIRERAFARRMAEFVLPSQEVLAQRLFAKSIELAEVRRHLQAYHEMLLAMRARIAAGEAAGTLLDFLDGGLRQILGSEPEHFEAGISMLEAVTAHITVRPSGHQFLVEGNDSLLQAGVKAGIQLGYGCGNGACGLCKARLIAGELRALAKGDYRLTERETEQGYVLLCTHTAVSDAIIEILEATGPQDIPRQQIVARVRAITQLAPNTLLLHLQTPRSHRLRFLAGQSVTLGASSSAGDLSESVPLASCPCDERNLHFHFPRELAGALGHALFQGVIRVGDAIDVHGPDGQFVLDASAQRPPVFVACDCGFGPIKSLVEHTIAIDAFESIALYWHATRSDGHYLANQCRSWAASLDQFRFEPSSDPSAITGAKTVASSLLSEPAASSACAVYVAGPVAFVDTLVRVLTDGGMRREQILALAL
jgi:CDP-4-dehydro-6-deoxyglucose reductase